MVRIHVLNKVQRLQKHATILIVVLLLSVSWLLIYYLHTNAQIRKYRHQIKDFEKQKELFAKTRTENSNLQDMVRNLKVSLRTSKEGLNFQDQDLSQQQMTKIARSARKKGLKLESFVIQPAKRKEWYTKQKVTYGVSGDSEQINQFIHEIKTKEQGFKCKKLALEKKDDGAALLCELQFLTFKPKFQSV